MREYLMPGFQLSAQWFLCLAKVCVCVFSSWRSRAEVSSLQGCREGTGRRYSKTLVEENAAFLCVFFGKMSVASRDALCFGFCGAAEMWCHCPVVVLMPQRVTTARNIPAQRLLSRYNNGP